MFEIAQENRKLSAPLTRALNEVERLRDVNAALRRNQYTDALHATMKRQRRRLAAAEHALTTLRSQQADAEAAGRDGAASTKVVVSLNLDALDETRGQVEAWQKVSDYAHGYYTPT